MQIYVVRNTYNDNIAEQKAFTQRVDAEALADEYIMNTPMPLVITK